jgi:hypothetical protein
MCGLQPRHASPIGGGPRNSSGSLAMLAAMRRASSQILPVLSSLPSLFRLTRNSHARSVPQTPLAGGTTNTAQAASGLMWTA